MLFWHLAVFVSSLTSCHRSFSLPCIVEVSAREVGFRAYRVGQYPSDSKSNGWLHVHICWFWCSHSFGVCSIDNPTTMDNSSKVLNFNQLFLNSTGSFVTSCQFSLNVGRGTHNRSLRRFYANYGEKYKVVYIFSPWRKMEIERIAYPLVILFLRLRLLWIL